MQDLEELVVKALVFQQYLGGCEGAYCSSGMGQSVSVALHSVSLVTEKPFTPDTVPPFTHPRIFGGNEAWMTEQQLFEDMDCLDSSWPVNSCPGDLTNIPNNWALITKGGMKCNSDIPSSLYDVGIVL